MAWFWSTEISTDILGDFTLQNKNKACGFMPAGFPVVISERTAGFLWNLTMNAMPVEAVPQL
jgi:hypothetical protein